MDKTHELAGERIRVLMWRYFVPAAIGITVNAMYNIVDRIYIGRGVGALALSGITVLFPVFLIVMAFGMLIGMGSGVLVSISLGKQDKAQAEKVLSTAFFLMIAVSLVITLVGFLVRDDLLMAFGAQPETIGYARDYFNIIILGTVFSVVGFSFNNIIRSEGNARIAMTTMLLSGFTNLILDPIFIFYFKMGVQGAAIATVISHMVMVVWVVLHFRGKKSVLKFNFKLELPSWDITKQIVAIGVSPFVMQIASSAVQGLLNLSLIKHGGDLAVAAMGIITSLSSFVIMIIVAINMAMQPIVGFNFGANNMHRVKQTLKAAIFAATTVSVVAFVIIQLFPTFFVHLFNNDTPQLTFLGKQGLTIYLLMLPVIGFQIVAGNYFQSIGKAKVSIFLSTLRQVIILIPMLIILPKYFGLHGIWMAGPIADFVSAIVVAVFLIIERKKYHRGDYLM